MGYQYLEKDRLFTWPVLLKYPTNKKSLDVYKFISIKIGSYPVYLAIELYAKPLKGLYVASGIATKIRKLR